MRLTSDVRVGGGIESGGAWFVLKRQGSAWAVTASAFDVMMRPAR